MPNRAAALFAPIAALFGRARQTLAAGAISAASFIAGPSLRNFSGGTPRIAAEVRSILGTFKPQQVTLRQRLLMRDDPDVAFGLAILRAPIINLQWSIESEDDELAAFAEAVLRPLYHQLAVGGSMAIHFGNQVLAKEYTVLDSLEVKQTEDAGAAQKKTYRNAIVFSRFKTIHPQTITLLIDQETDDWGGVEQAQSGGAKVRVGRDGAVLWSYRRQEVFGSLQGYPQSDQYFDPWYTKHGLRFCRNRYMEHRADPPVKAWAGPELIKGGEKIDGYEYMNEQVSALKGGGTFTMPNGYDERGNRIFDMELMQDDKRGDMFQQAIDKEGTQIFRSMWIGDKAATSGDGEGSMAQAQVHAETMASGLQSALTEWIDVLNRQVLTPLLELNFGLERTRSAQARFVGSGISPAMKELFRALIMQLLTVESMQQEGKRVTLLSRIDAPALAQQLGVPLRSEDEVKAEGVNHETDEEAAARELTGKPGDPPAPGAPPTGEQDVVVTEDAVLNGAQISAAVDIVAKVVTGEIPGDAALGMLEVLFNLDTDQAKKILGSAKEAKKDPGPPPATPPSPTAGAGVPAPAPVRGGQGGPGLPVSGA